MQITSRASVDGYDFEIVDGTFDLHITRSGEECVILSGQDTKDVVGWLWGRITPVKAVAADPRTIVPSAENKLAEIFSKTSQQEEPVGDFSNRTASVTKPLVLGDPFRVPPGGFKDITKNDMVKQMQEAGMPLIPSNKNIRL